MYSIRQKTDKVTVHAWSGSDNALQSYGHLKFSKMGRMSVIVRSSNSTFIILTQMLGT